MSKDDELLQYWCKQVREYLEFHKFLNRQTIKDIANQAMIRALRCELEEVYLEDLNLGIPAKVGTYYLPFRVIGQDKWQTMVMQNGSDSEIRL